MGKKYILLKNDTIIYEGVTLYRIKSLKDSYNVKKDDLGGYIEKEDNLSHDGNAWVYEDAWVYGDAWVYEDAWVYRNAKVYGNARVYGYAEVFGDAEVYGNAKVYGYARVYEDAILSKGNWDSGDVKEPQSSVSQLLRVI